MYVQVIQGRIADAAGLQRQMDRWLADLAPGATGWLGSTGGITDDGDVVLLARFESAEAARANSDRPEQGAWWAETSACLDGEASFAEGTEVDTMGAGGSDTAGFVQIMRGRATDPEKVRKLEAEMEDLVMARHKALIGSWRVWTGGDEFTDVVYFTDEEAARAGEKAMGDDPELGARLPEWQSAFADVRYFDLRQPMLVSP